MFEFILSNIILIIFICMMSIGVIFSNKILKGSCGDCDCTEIQKNNCPIKK